MKSIVASLLPDSAEQALTSIASVSQHSDLVEIRADRLNRESLRSVLARCECETIVTVRRAEEGGRFDGSQADREALLQAALDAGTRWVDVEFDGALAGWADGPYADRVILSQHGVRCSRGALTATLDRMCATRAARIKIVAEPDSPSEIVAIRDLLARAEGERLCAFGLSAAGALSRIFALSWGSWGTYGAEQHGAETAPGQFPVEQLSAGFNVRDLGRSTRVAALLGSRLLGLSPSAAMHNAGYRAAGMNRVYVPLECADWATGTTLCERLGWSDLGVTMPFKSLAAAAAATLDPVATAAQAVNTMVDGHGFNTDGPAAVDCLERCGLVAGDAVDLLGSGGTARAIAAALVKRGHRAAVWSRRGELSGLPTGVTGGSLLDRIPGSADWLINATPVTDSSLLGGGPPARKGVLEAVYGQHPSQLLRRAAEHDLAAVDGLGLLVAQARRQFFLHCGQFPECGLFAAIGQRYLAQLG